MTPCIQYNITSVLRKNQGSSLYTFFVRYRWLWFPRTTGTNGSRLWFSHYRGWNMDGSGETRFCGPVYGPWLSLRFVYGPVYDSRLSLRVGSGPVYDSRLSLRVGSGPVCTQYISSRISHAFNFRHAFTASYQVFYIISTTSAVSPAAASCADCTSWMMHWLRLSCCAAMTALYF